MVEELVELLKQARQEKGISLSEISEETKIQIYYLEALENADFDRFPGEVYLKGALTNYATMVGLEPKRVLDLYRNLGREEPPGEESKLPPKRKTVPLPRPERAPSLIYGLIILALLLTAGGYLFVEQCWPRKSPQEPVSAEPPVATETEGDKPETVKPKPPEAAVKLTVSKSNSTSWETVFSVGNADSLDIKLTGLERCWVEMRTDDEEEFPSRILQKGEKITARAKDRIWIRLGHPPGARLKINGITVKETEEQKRPHNFLFVRK
mgnify:FL=1